MCIKSGVWALRSRNMKFRSVFVVNCLFRFHRRLTPLDIEQKIENI
jgi:hypothetical protein